MKVETLRTQEPQLGRLRNVNFMERGELVLELHSVERQKLTLKSHLLPDSQKQNLEH